MGGAGKSSGRERITAGPQGPGHRRTQLRQAAQGGGADLKGNKGKSISLTNCERRQAVGGWGGVVESKRFTPPHTPLRACLSIKTDAGVCLCMCWGRGGLELVEIMNLGGFVFQVYLRGIFVGHLPTPNHDRQPRQTTNQEGQSLTSVYGN